MSDPTPTEPVFPVIGDILKRVFGRYRFPYHVQSRLLEEAEDTEYNLKNAAMFAFGGIGPDGKEIKFGGTAGWGALVIYEAGELATGSDGRVYRAVGQTKGMDPTTDDGSNWRPAPSVAATYYVADGDSRTGNNGPVGLLNWFNLLVAQTDHLGVIGKNFGLAGKSIQQIRNSYAAFGPAPTTAISGGHQFSPAVTGGSGVYFLWGATNDLPAPRTAAQVLSDLQAIYALAHAGGYFPVVGFTETVRTVTGIGGGFDATAEAARVTLNAALRGLTLGLANTPDILIDTDRLFPSLAGNIYPDALHLSAYAERLLARVVRARLNGLADPAPAFAVARCADGGPTFPTSGGTAKIPLVSRGTDYDPLGLIDATDKSILCPTDGMIYIEAWFVKTGVTAGDSWNLSIYRTPAGGSAASVGRVAWAYEPISTGGFNDARGSMTLKVSAGDKIDFRVVPQSGNNGWAIFGAIGNEIMSSFSLRYLPLAT